jgi:hypothetical protein
LNLLKGGIISCENSLGDKPHSSTARIRFCDSLLRVNRRKKGKGEQSEDQTQPDEPKNAQKPESSKEKQISSDESEDSSVN